MICSVIQTRHIENTAVDLDEKSGDEMKMLFLAGTTCGGSFIFTTEPNQLSSRD